MRSRWLVVGLIASLTLNLFMIGAAAGVIALGVRMASLPRPRVGPLFWATQALPQPERRNIRAMLAQTRREVRPESDRSLALRADAWTALAAPRPDPTAIKDQLAQSRQIDLAVRATLEGRLVDYVVGLDAKDRAIFAASMRRLMRPHGRRAQSSSNAAANATAPP